MRLPQDWETVCFDEVTPTSAPIIYGILQPGPFIINGVPYVRPSEIECGEIDAGAIRKTSPEISRKYARSKLQKGDLILSIVGTIGKVAEVPAWLEGGNITQSSCRIRPDTKVVNGRFLKFYLVSPASAEQFSEGKLGTAVPRLNLVDVRKLQLPLPPLAEQRRIVDKLDDLTAHLAHARAELVRVPTLVQQMKQQALSLCFPRHSEYPAVLLGNILRGVQAGKNLRCEERPPHPGELGVVKVSAVTWGRFDPTKAKTLPPEYIPPEVARISVGDLLMSRANTIDLVGAVALVERTPHDLFLSDKVLRLVVPEDAKRWLLWFLRSPSGREQIERMATGNQLSMRNLSQDALRRIELPFPDAATRLGAVRELEAAFARADRLEAEAARAAALLDRLEASILAKAFRGELVPQDPADEPASALLDRIRTERAAATQAKHGRRVASAASN